MYLPHQSASSLWQASLLEVFLLHDGSAHAAGISDLLCTDASVVRSGPTETVHQLRNSTHGVPQC